MPEYRGKACRELLMRALLKQPGLKAEIIDIPNELEALQREVNGYIETITLTRHLAMICNEEGRIRNMLPNFYLHGELIVGPVLFVGVKGDGFRDITDDEIAQAKRKMKFDWRDKE